MTSKKFSKDPLFDTRVSEILNLPTPREVKELMPLSKEGEETVRKARNDIRAVIHGKDSRMLLGFGPCSIHNAYQYLEFAQKADEQIIKQVEDVFVCFLRGAIEKPRTGEDSWRGLLKDPDLNGRVDIRKGVYVVRDTFRNVVNLGIPIATEPIELYFVNHFDDLISMYWIGARSVPAEIYKDNASAFSAPTGFKNTEDGNVKVAIGSMSRARISCTFPGFDQDGRGNQVTSKGNPDIFLIVRGGRDSSNNPKPNYYLSDVVHYSHLLAEKGLPKLVLVDTNHLNSDKDPDVQMSNIRYVMKHQRGKLLDSPPYLGILAEVYFEKGAQELVYGQPLMSRHSITDPCSSLAEFRECILREADLIRKSKK